MRFFNFSLFPGNLNFTFHTKFGKNPVGCTKSWKIEIGFLRKYGKLSKYMYQKKEMDFTNQVINEEI